MITKFETTGASDSSESGSNTLLYVLGFAVLAFLGYKYVYLPSQEKKAKELAEAKK